MKRLIGLTLAAVLIGGGCTCLDTSGFHPYACDVDGGDAQCPGDGVCGLEGVCHARGDEQAWRCLDDSHCEGSWRCGPEGTCLDPDREALVPADAEVLVAARIGHLLPDGLPSHVAGSATTAFLPVPACVGTGTMVGDYQTQERTARFASLVLEGGLYTVVKWDGPRTALPDGGFPTVTDCAAFSDGGLGERSLDVVRVPAPPLLDLAVSESTTYVLQDGGVVCRYTPDHLLAQDRTCEALYSSTESPQRLRLTEGAPTNGQLLLGLGPDHVQLHHLDGGLTGPVQRIALPDGGSAPINDAIAYGREEPLLMAATPSGVFARRLDGRHMADGGPLKDDTHWEPVATGFGTFCGESLAATPAATPLRFGLANDGQALLVLHRNDHGNGAFDEQLAMLVMPAPPSPFPPPGECVYVTAPFSTPLQPISYEPWVHCQPCPTNSEVRWFRVGIEGFSNQAAPMVEARCSNPDGGVDLTGLDPTGRCDPFGDHASSLGLTAPLEGARHHRPVTVDTSSVTGLTVADDLAHLWQPLPSWTLYPWTLDRVPALVYRDQGLIAYRGTETHGHGDSSDQPLVVVEALALEEGPRGYALASDGYPQVLAPVAGHPRWLLVREDQEVGLDVVGVVELLPDGVREGTVNRRGLAHLSDHLHFGPPYHLATSVTSGGQTVLLVATADTVLAADLTQSLAATPQGPYAISEFFAAELAVRFTAVSHSPVQSLTTVKASSGPGAAPQFVRGYLVQGFRLFSFQASSINVWRTEELILKDTTEPLAVFADGVRARVGMKNGTVYSLPSQLRLADPLPEVAQPVTSYHLHCGHLFAVGAEGLYRLAVGAEPQGTWERVDLPEHHRIVGGKLFSEDAALRFFTADGVGLHLTGFTCREPATE